MCVCVCVCVCVSGILFEAGMEKPDDNNSPLLHNLISSHNSVRQEMKFCMCSRFLAQIVPISKFRLVPSFESAH